MYARVWRSISARGVPGLRRACQAVIRSNRSSKDWSWPVSSVQWLQYRPVSIGMPQLSQAGVGLMMYSLGCVGRPRGRSCRLNERAERAQQRVGLIWVHPGQRASEQVCAEYLALSVQSSVPGRGQPDQGPAPVGRVAFAL
jgi:hypothetical protein